VSVAGRWSRRRRSLLALSLVPVTITTCAPRRCSAAADLFYGRPENHLMWTIMMKLCDG